MKNVIRVLFWCVILVSCAIRIPKKHHDNVEPELQDMLNVIKVTTKRKLGTKTKYLGWFKEDTRESKKGKVIGTCSKFIDWENTTISTQIDIHKESWDAYSTTSKFILLAHEVHHCECGSDHIKKNLKDGCPSHFMGEFMPDKYCMKRHWLRYLKQVKKGCDE